MKHTLSLLPVLRKFARLGLPLMVAAGAAQAATIDLADQPLFSTVSVPGNLILTLSVEFPTANTSAYFSTSAYAATTTYLGYFDAGKCYQYVPINSGTSSAPNYSTSYFQPYGAATSNTCSSGVSPPLWSGNYMNWASMQSLDEFRWVLTGGNRSADTTTMTVLQKTYHSGQDNGGDAPNKKVPTSSIISAATPFSWSALNTRIWGMGAQMVFTNSATLTGAVGSFTVVPYTNQAITDSGSNGSAQSNAVYSVYINVRVCDSNVGIETNCVLYGNNYKPEGLMQKYANELRYSAFGYLNDSNAKRDGGVLRGRMKYIGPTQPVSGSSPITNGATEWSSSTGIMLTNPDTADATSTTNNSTTAGHTVTISQSGVMNYLNKFGYTAGNYKTYDSVGELYYSAIRYLKNQGNVPEYSDLGTTNSLSTITQWLDGFPVITNWTDPILYACQKNFILGIGDVNTWRDADLPGTNSSMYNSGQEPTTPATVTADTTVSVTTATNMVGQIEGISNLATTYINSSRWDTYFIAGLAYDSHTVDMRSDLAGVQTVNTYWLDVLENQVYLKNNQYYLATKYGGFTVPTGFSPYATTNGTSTLPLSSWHTNSDANFMSSGNARPDNYFTANQPAVMQSGLTTAFAKIATEAAAANSTSFSTPTPNVTTSGAISYSASYDPSTWTGDVVGSSVTFASNGTPTLTAQWHARALLSSTATTASTRKIITCCTATTGAYGLPFTLSSLSGSTLNARTYYTSFNNVPGAASQSTANYIAYLRGDTSQEIANGGAYRTRTYRLGDIVNSKPVAVGTPGMGYFDTTNPGYSAFVAANSSRATVVYAGANDGMLHAFDGSVGASTSGSELFAYIPSFVYGTSSTASTTGLASLGNPSFAHHYFVDATPVQVDIDMKNTYGATATANDWRSLLIGGLGKGGTGYYALDVTSVPTSTTTEATIASKVLWEFTDSRMGYSYGKPDLVKTAKYGWVAIFTSGYNNADGVGYFFIVNPRTGALLEAVSTGAGSTSAPLNLGPFSTHVENYSDRTADAAYAGDLQGNVWRLDLTGTPSAYPAPTKIALLRDASGNAQPVTTIPLIEAVPSSNARYVLIGTGRLLADSDIASSAVQTFYAIADGTATNGGFYTSSTLPSGYSFPIQRASLNANTNLVSGLASSPTSPMGWYYDLPTVTTTTGAVIAQRVDVDPTANAGVVAFAGNTPNGQTCSPSGTGTIYAVSFASGKTVLIDSSTGAYTTSTTIGTSVITDIQFLNVNGSVQIVAGDSLGNSSKINTKIPSGTVFKQLNWREIPATN